MGSAQVYMADHTSFYLEWSQWQYWILNQTPLLESIAFMKIFSLFCSELWGASAVGTEQGQLISSGNSLCQVTQGLFLPDPSWIWGRGSWKENCCSSSRKSREWTPATALESLGWSNVKVLNRVLRSLWKIKSNNHLWVWNSKVDCCIVSENRQLDQTPFNAWIFLEKTLWRSPGSSLFLCPKLSTERKTFSCFSKST